MKPCPSCSFANANDAAYCISCGFALSSATPDGAAAAEPFRPGYLAPGTIVDGKYRVERVLGEGGMGVVYLAHDVHTDMQVVVKAIRAEFAHDPEFRARTLAEGRALARIDHPNVVRLNAVVVEPATLYLVMQFIEGEPLDRLIERHVAAHARVPIELALSIFRMILRGVGAAHAEGLIHRDLKPANILLRKKDGVAKVTDFGIAKGEEDAKAGRGVTKGIIGSVSYMAPEQVRGRRDLDKRVDIYALGILLFELLIGRTPFEAPSDFEVMRMHAEAPLPSVLLLRPDVPAHLGDVVRRACAKERDHRFANTEEFLAALDAPPPPRTVPLTASPPPSGSGTAPGNVMTEVPVEPIRQPNSPGLATQVADFKPPPSAVARGVTEEGSALSSAPAFAPAARRPTALLAALALGAIGAAGAAVYFVATSDGDDSRAVTSSAPRKDANAVARGDNASSPDAGAAATTTTPTAPVLPEASTPNEPEWRALTALSGHWKSTTNREYEAVVEVDGKGARTFVFRIWQPSQHPRQGYEREEVRFALKPIPGKLDEFAVEDHIRPTPPPGFEYDPQSSRGSCVATWTSVKGRPLLAQVDAKGALVVDLVQIRTGLDKFKIEGRRVVACNDLGASPAEPIESRLSRMR